MKRFLNKVFLYCLLLFIILAFFDLSLSRFIQASRQREYASWNDIIHGNANADIIVMGSSRAWAQYSPQILDTILNAETYNIGIDGSGINRQINKYQLYRHYNKKPSIILQNVDFSTMGITKGYERHQYFPYFWIPFFRKVIFPNEPFSLVERILPFYRYSHFGIRNLFKEQRTLSKGYRGNDMPWDGSKLAQQSLISFEPDTLATTMFEKYLKDAQEEGIQVFLVFAPVYIGATLKIKNLEEMYSYYESFAEKYGAKIIDFNYDDISMDTLFFYNATHLNKSGAELFSKKLGIEIKEILSRDTAGK